MQSGIKHRTHKRCPRCENVLPRDRFPRNKNRPDGLHAYCLACNREKQANDRQTKWHKEMRKRYRSSPRGRRAYERYYEKSAPKRRAQIDVMNALNRGDLIKPERCESCGEARRLDGHHDDYAKPLDVRWLCRWCHLAWHREHGEAPNAELPQRK